MCTTHAIPVYMNTQLVKNSLYLTREDFSDNGIGYVVVLCCVLRTTTQVNGKERNSTPHPQKPLNQSSPKFAWVIRSGTPTPMQNFITIWLPTSPPNMWKCASRDWASFFQFFPAPTAKTPVPIFTINTSNDVVSRRDVPFGVPKTKFYIYTPFSNKKANFSPIFDRTKISHQNGLNNGDAHL